MIASYMDSDCFLYDEGNNEAVLLKPVKLKLESSFTIKLYIQTEFGNHCPKTSHGMLSYKPHFQTSIKPSPYKNKAQTLTQPIKIWTVTSLSPISYRNCLPVSMGSQSPSTCQVHSFTHSFN